MPPTTKPNEDGAKTPTLFSRANSAFRHDPALAYIATPFLVSYRWYSHARAWWKYRHIRAMMNGLNATLKACEKQGNWNVWESHEGAECIMVPKDYLKP